MRAIHRAIEERAQVPLLPFQFRRRSGSLPGGYQDADGALAHLENVGALLGELLKAADLTRLEVHGPANELAKLRGPLADFKPQFFTLDYGFRRK
jgi:hypothetical protein